MPNRLLIGMDLVGVNRRYDFGSVAATGARRLVTILYFRVCLNAFLVLLRPNWDLVTQKRAVLVVMTIVSTT